MITVTESGAPDNERQGASVAPRFPAVPLSIRGPLYIAAIGLFVVYSKAYLEAGLGALAWGLIGVTAAAEFVKPKLGELAAAAIECRDATAQALLASAAAVCIVVGAAGGVMAMHVADAPRLAIDAAKQALADAGAAVAEAERRLDDIPACAPDMPASRCMTMAAENAGAIAERRSKVSEAQATEARARRSLAQLPDPGPGLPNIELWQKFVFSAAIELLIFGVPFAARRVALRLTHTAPLSRLPASKINDGGWASRRAKYGPTGRKSTLEPDFGTAPA